MMKKVHILLILLLAVFLVPSGVFACGKSHSEMKCCKKEITSKTDKKECCKNKTSKDKKQTGCKGKCGQTLCSTSSVYSAISSPVSFEIQNDNFNFASKKQIFYSLETITSNGYSSIWLIPKIS